MRRDTEIFARVYVSILGHAACVVLGLFLVYRVYAAQGFMSDENARFLGLVLLFLLNPFLYGVTRNHHLVGMLAIVELLIMVVHVTYFLGGGYSFGLVWFAVIPAVAILIGGRRLALVGLLLASFGALVIYALQSIGHEFPHLITGHAGIRVNAYLIVCGLIFMFVLGALYEWINRQAQAGLRSEIARRRQAEDLIGDQKMRLETMLESIGDGVVITGTDGLIEYVNPASEELSGYSAHEVRGKDISEVFPGAVGRDSGGRTPPALVAESAVSVDDLRRLGVGREDRTIVIDRHDGERVVHALATPLIDRAGQVTGTVAVFRDVTESYRLNAELGYRATHDALTGLPNRALLLDRLTHAIAQASRLGQVVAVLFVDLDRFKVVNDSLGHSAGDAAIGVVARRIKDGVREGDTVARIGGDEFAIVLENLRQREIAARVAETVLRALECPIAIRGQEFVLGASIGIAVYASDGDDAETLLRNADAAMYLAKKGGRGRIRYYTREMTDRQLRRLRMEHDLRRALHDRELELHFQPQVKLSSGKVVAVEALARWAHPELGPVRATSFVSLAEDTGLIVPLGEWVLGEACRQAKEWERAGLRAGRVAVNLSPRQVVGSNAVKTIEDMLHRSGLAAERLEVEITENMFLEDTREAYRVMFELAELGVSISLDDFGTGYSSLGYLKRFPISRLKIDQTFVRDVAYDSDDAAIATAIIAMGHSLGLEVVAEGVEQESQVRFMRERGCDVVQGNYFCAPSDGGELGRILRDWPSAEGAPVSARHGAAGVLAP